MGRAGHRILVDAGVGGEIAGDEVGGIRALLVWPIRRRRTAFGRDDQAVAGQGPDGGKIGPDGGHGGGVLEPGQHLAPGQHAAGFQHLDPADGGRNLRPRLDGLGRLRGKIEAEAVAGAGHRKRSRGRGEGDTLQIRGQIFQHHRPRGERGMTAEVDLHGRRKPADRPVVSLADQKGGLRQVVLRGDGLHLLGRQPVARQGADGGRIAGKETIGKGIELVERKVGHVRSPVIFARPAGSHPGGR